MSSIIRPASYCGNVALKRGAVIRLEADPRDLHIFDADGRSFLAAEPAAKAA